MTVHDIIKRLESTSGTWSRPRPVIDSTSIQRSPIESPLLGILDMISSLGTVSSILKQTRLRREG
jgi:hypothetical protein